jgi:hypothetical protein
MLLLRSGQTKATTVSSTIPTQVSTSNETLGKRDSRVMIRHRISLMSSACFSPFALKEPSAILKGTKPGFTRDEAAEFVRKARRDAS